MKNLNKTLLAAALMVAAGSANASLAQGEAYLVAFDANYIGVDGITMGRTFNLDLGTTFAALQANATSALSAFEGASALNNLAADANWTAFNTLGAGEATQSITYGVYASGQAGNLPTNGVFATSSSLPTPPQSGNFANAIFSIDTHAAEINLGMPTGTSSLIKGLDTQATGQADSKSYITVWGGAAFDPTAAYGSANNFYADMSHLTPVTGHHGTVITAVTTQSDISLLGAFTLSGNTLSYAAATVTPPAAVPLPAAVWLFGAGLMGVLRINRRKSVQA